MVAGEMFYQTMEGSMLTYKHNGEKFEPTTENPFL